MTPAALALAVLAGTSAVTALRSARAAAVVRRRLGAARSGRAAVPWSLVAAGAAGAAWWYAGPVLAVAAGASALAAPRARARRSTRLAAAVRTDALPDVVDATARAIRAGSSPRVAFADAADGAPPEARDSLRRAAAAAEQGLSLAEAIDRWARSSGIDGAPLVAAAVAVTSGAGGDTARSLASVADTLREQRALRREVRALSSQARASAAVIAVAPAAFAVLAATTDRAIADFLLRTPLGTACLLAGLGLEVAGWRWMVRITESVR